MRGAGDRSAPISASAAAQVREHTGWGDTQLTMHLERLVELEYVLVHRGGRGQSFVYELVYDGASDDARHAGGLIDVEALRHACTTRERSGSGAPQSASVGPWSAALSAGGQGLENAPGAKPSSAQPDACMSETPRPRRRSSSASYAVAP